MSVREFTLHRRILTVLETRRILKDGFLAHVLRNRISGLPLFTPEQRKQLALSAIAASIAGATVAFTMKHAKHITEQNEIFVGPAANTIVGTVVRTVMKI